MPRYLESPSVRIAARKQMNEYTIKDAIDKPFVEEENEFLLEAAIYLSNNKEQSFHQFFFAALTPNQQIVVILRN